MIEKGIIEETYHESNEFVSPIFIKHKQDEGIRLTPNLKKLKKNVKYEHFNPKGTGGGGVISTTP